MGKHDHRIDTWVSHGLTWEGSASQMPPHQRSVGGLHLTLCMMVKQPLFTSPAIMLRTSASSPVLRG